MYFIISHFTNNKWTTDYLLKYLENNNISYYYLRHPFNFQKQLNYSELIYFDWKYKKIIWKYKKNNSFIFDLLRNFYLNFYLSIKLFRKYKKIIWFWSFNVVPVLFIKFFNKSIYFYWVDYSTKRFNNSILNGIYKIFETLCSKFSNKIFNVSIRQEKARIKYHWLDKNRSFIIHNWIELNFLDKDFNKYWKVALLYLWSITEQHGIINFIKHFYIDKWIKNNLYIIWWWEREKELLKVVRENNLEKYVKILWNKNKDSIKKILLSINEKLFWIAPYDKKENDHVYYWDALKIKEYLMYNIPYITSNVLYIQKEFNSFWFIYNNFDEIDFNLLKSFKLNIDDKNKVLKKYDWNNLFNNFFKWKE